MYWKLAASSILTSLAPYTVSKTYLLFVFNDLNWREEPLLRWNDDEKPFNHVPLEKFYWCYCAQCILCGCRLADQALNWTKYESDWYTSNDRHNYESFVRRPINWSWSYADFIIYLEPARSFKYWFLCFQIVDCRNICSITLWYRWEYFIRSMVYALIKFYTVYLKKI